MSFRRYCQKLPPDTPNVASVSSGLMSQETEEISKELKKMHEKGKETKKYCLWTLHQQLEISKHAAKKWICQHTLIPVFKISVFNKAICY